jgi:hypothetical protein
MNNMKPVHSSLSGEEVDPKYHTDSRCPHYHELRDNGHVAQGDGGLNLCNWCETN